MLGNGDVTDLSTCILENLHAFLHPAPNWTSTIPGHCNTKTCLKHHVTYDQNGYVANIIPIFVVNALYNMFVNVRDICPFMCALYAILEHAHRNVIHYESIQYTVNVGAYTQLIITK